MGFKEDQDFARFLTMGAVGTAYVARDLQNRFGHRPIELERQAMANKVWAVKVKRLRIPDLVCVDCGRRVESKAKTKLEVKMSHSSTPGREWSAGGMRDGDVYSFVRIVSSDGQLAAVGQPAYFTRDALARAEEYMRRGGRKAASEGSEADVAWPSWVPNVDGTLVGLENDEMFFDTADGKRRKYWQSRLWPVRHLYLRSGDRFEAASTIVAGVAEPIGDLRCPGDSWDVEKDLVEGDQDDRYAAIKAAGARKADGLVPVLRRIIENPDEDWRVTLEAMASLARTHPDDWAPRIGEIAVDIERDVAEQMEAVFILSEIPGGVATDALKEVGAPAAGRHEEVRSAAVWGLGTGAFPVPELALAFARDADDRVALHAAAAVQTLSEDAVDTLDAWLRGDDARSAAVAAAILAQHHRVDLLVAAANEGGTARLWALQALGDLSPDEVRAAAGAELTPELEAELAPLWVQHDDWLRTPDNEGALPVLTEQQIRFDPMGP